MTLIDMHDELVFVVPVLIVACLCSLLKFASFNVELIDGQESTADKSQARQWRGTLIIALEPHRSIMMSVNGNSPAVEAAASTPRSRLPRWTRHETLVLIQARRAMERRGLQQPVRPKWAAVSAYCRRHGVERGPMQCRKRWGNLSWDLKKIVAWEGNRTHESSFWDMRGDERRARQLPSSFDREVYDAIVAGEDAAAVDFGEEMDGAFEQPPIMAVPISGQHSAVVSCHVTLHVLNPAF